MGNSALVQRPRLGNFIAQHFANKAWAFATAIQSDAALFAAMARLIEACLRELIAQKLALGAKRCVGVGDGSR